MAFVKRFLLLLVLWLVLSGGHPGAWVPGLIAAAGAAALSLRLLPPSGVSLRLLPLPGLVKQFLRDSLAGGVDVARRAFDPRLPVRPGWIRCRVQLAGGRRMLLGDIVSLMPGTMCAGAHEGALLVHCLDTGQPVQAQITGFERRLMTVLGEGGEGG